MPRKKKEMPIQQSDSFTAGKPEPVVEAAPDPVAEVKAEVSKCGHQNKHYTGAEVLLCEMPKGHEGNHVGWLNDKQGTPHMTEWKDEAGYAISN